MNRRLALILAAGLPLAAAADEPVDLAMVTRIRDEAFHRSHVMETAGYLTDVIGGRVTGSPQLKAANEWTRQQFEAWGLADARLEPWGPFGVGWSLDHVSVHMVAPTVAPLYAIPKGWSPGTNGVLRAKAIKAKLQSESDFAAWKGKLAGRVVLLSDAVEVKPEDKPPFVRYSDKEIQDLERFEVPPPRKVDEERADDLKRHKFRRALRVFLAEEKAAAAIEPSSWPGVVRVMGTDGYGKDEPRGVPHLVMLTEQYNRLVRLLDRKLDVELELDVRVTYQDKDLMAYDTLADIPGGDKRDEVVLAGAHLDSWHAGTGATDNAAGVAVVMEAARILKALGVQPRRTIRFGLWTGEEQTEGGSEGYVARHLAERGAPADPEEKELPVGLQRRPGKLTLKPDYDRFSAYFNVDNGSGRIRGVYVEEDAALVPIFAAWLRPFADLGADHVTMRKTEDTDHESFQAAGLPGFQFIQDDLDYSTRTWHTNLDVYDRLNRDDLMQASAVLASFLYHAAMREERLPRKPLHEGAAP